MKTTLVKVQNIPLFITESEKSIQINDVIPENIVAIWEYLKADYAGYEVFFSFNSERMGSNQEIPLEFLAEINAILVDDTLNFRLNVEDFKPESGNELEISPLTEAGFAEFAQLHDYCNPDFFWTSKRLRDCLDIWQIHTLKSCEQLTGYVMTMLTKKNFAEIFTIESHNELEFKALLSTACKTAFTGGKAEILYMIEKATLTNHQQAAIDLGFKKTGFYKGFRAVS